jgi:phosphoribosylformylglycinamidine cyclo-ligase
MKKQFVIKGLSHITGGGIIGNTMRIIPKGLSLSINWEAWEIPPILKLIQQTGSIEINEMREVFNLGIGLIAIVSKDESEKLIEYCNSKNEKAILMGEVV